MKTSIRLSREYLQMLADLQEWLDREDRSETIRKVIRDTHQELQARKREQAELAQSA